MTKVISEVEANIVNKRDIERDAIIKLFNRVVTEQLSSEKEQALDPIIRVNNISNEFKEIVKNSDEFAPESIIGINYTKINHKDLFHWAARNGHREILKKLWDILADAPEQQKEMIDSDVFEDASDSNQPEVLTLIWKCMESAQRLEIIKSEMHGIFRSTVENGRAETLKQLLEIMNDYPDEASEIIAVKNYQLFRLAVMFNKIEILELLWGWYEGKDEQIEIIKALNYYVVKHAQLYGSPEVLKLLCTYLKNTPGEFEEFLKFHDGNFGNPLKNLTKEAISDMVYYIRENIPIAQLEQKTLEKIEKLLSIIPIHPKICEMAVARIFQEEDVVTQKKLLGMITPAEDFDQTEYFKSLSIEQQKLIDYFIGINLEDVNNLHPIFDFKSNSSEEEIKLVLDNKDDSSFRMDFAKTKIKHEQEKTKTLEQNLVENKQKKAEAIVPDATKIVLEYLVGGTVQQIKAALAALSADDKGEVNFSEEQYITNYDYLQSQLEMNAASITENMPADLGEDSMSLIGVEASEDFNM